MIYSPGTLKGPKVPAAPKIKGSAKSALKHKLLTMKLKKV